MAWISSRRAGPPMFSSILYSLWRVPDPKVAQRGWVCEPRIVWNTKNLILMLGKIEGRRRRGCQDEMVGWHH